MQRIAMGLALAWLTTAATAQTNRNINVEVRTVEISKAALKDLGVEWAVTVGRPTFPQLGRLGRDVNFAAEIRALEAKKSSRSHSTTRLLTLNGKPGLLFIGQQHPFTIVTYNGFGGFTQGIQFVEFGVRLVALPELQEDGTIKLTLRFDTMSIEPPLASPIAGTVFPLFKARRHETTLIVKDGETVVAGQFYSNDERKHLSGVPGISSVPVFGWLFGRQTKERESNELVLFVTATVMP